MEISLENLYVDTGAYRVKQLGPGRKESICVPWILFKRNNAIDGQTPIHSFTYLPLHHARRL